MTIGKNSRKRSARSSIRAPKFLDKSSGFYGRLDEPEVAGEVEVEVRWSGTEDSNQEGGILSNGPSEVHVSGVEEVEAFEGMMEDDGETLLQRKPTRRSSRWRRSSRRKQKEGRGEEDVARDERTSLGTEGPSDTMVTIKVEVEEEEGGRREREPAMVHFPAREDADDQVLIRDKKRGREEEEEGEEERRMKREQEEGMKEVKRNTVKNYRKVWPTQLSDTFLKRKNVKKNPFTTVGQIKNTLQEALDRAFRRGWEAFITNLYSVTLTPVTSSSPPSSSPSSKKKQQHTSVLEFR